MTPRITLPCLAILVGACATGTVQREVPPPLPDSGQTAFAEAARIQLPEREPGEEPGLHNVYRLSEDIVSGAEPEGDEAFAALAAMGIQTILSVDGKAPDQATAARYGIRYVHVPIRYSGITRDEQLEIAKTFYELDGPFYVHCFHGKHRGPAAAAIGRVVLDGASRDEAIAEMRQWCGTSEKYEGLYATIAFGDLPSLAEASACPFDFPAEHRFTGFRQGMIELTRSFETVEALSKRDWKPMDDHPDANARNEADKVLGTFRQLGALPEVAERPADFHGWMADSTRDAEALADLLARFEGGDAEAGEQAKAATKALKASCSACHKVYRDTDH